MFYKIIVERYSTYTTQIEADNQQEAERIGRELLPALTADTDDITVQAKELPVNSLSSIKGSQGSAGMVGV